MLKNLLVLPDGREISSGAAGMGIQKLTLTQSVNSGQELTLGSVCAAMLEATVYDGGALRLEQGQEVTLYKLDASGNRIKQGVFLLETPVRAGQNSYKILGYDRVTRLDRDLTQWLESLSGWPYRLEDFARMVAKACGLELAGSFPELTVEKFAARGVTGRRLLEWVGQASGQFCKADPEGVLTFGWYTPAPATTLTVIRRTQADYTVAPVDNVRIALTDADVGVCYPDSGENTYSVVGNYLLSGKSSEQLRPIAQSLYERLNALRYTPCTIEALAETQLQPGQTIHLGDVTACIMTKTQTGQRETISGTGSYKRNCATVRNETTLKSLSGQVLEIRAEVEGLQVENRRGQSQFARLDLQVEGITAEVSRQNVQAESIATQLTRLQQNAQALTVSVENLQEQGANKVQTQFGLTIDGSAVHIHRSGSEMVNRLDETGMLVSRGDTQMLRADARGVLATDVSVRNFLVVGDHARFEDYETDRTACFYL